MKWVPLTKKKVDGDLKASIAARASHFTFTSTFYHEGSTTRLVNATSLSPGSYGLTITAYDLNGNSLSAVFSIIVKAAAIEALPDPLPAIALGAGIGGVVVLIIAIVLARKRS